MKLIQHNNYQIQIIKMQKMERVKSKLRNRRNNNKLLTKSDKHLLINIKL